MNIHFTLRAQGKKDPKIILNVFDSRLKGRKFMYSTGFDVSVKHWDKRKERAKPAPAESHEDYLLTLNQELDKIEQIVIGYFTLKYSYLTIDRTDLKNHIGRTLKNPIKDVTPEDFFTTCNTIIDTTKNKEGEPITEGTKRSKRQTIEVLRNFEVEKNWKLSLETIDLKFYHVFDQFMIDKGLNPNTRGKHFKEIKAILREADNRDYKVNYSFQKKGFKVIRKQPDNVYLSEDEIIKISELKLTPGLERVRDIFIMACFVGARHSDWYQIKKDSFITIKERELLRIKQTKTSDIIHIPIHTVVRSMLNKYNGTPPPVITNQKFNEALKLIGKKAELGWVNIGDKRVEKWTELSTHTARRSFATNAYLSGMDVYQIMKFTGHKSESSFLRYLKLDGKDFAMQAVDAKFFKGESVAKMKIAS